MLMATAMQSLRRISLGFGENVCVIGLGPLGVLAGLLHRLSGHYVMGWDINAFRCGVAKEAGFHGTEVFGSDGLVERCREFTRGLGFDGAVLAFGGEAGEAMRTLVGCMKKAPDGHPMGRISVVGHPIFAYRDLDSQGMTNIDIVRASRTGPGYHDEAWEVGAPYPPVFMRWTTRTNLELCMELLAEGRMNLEPLITRTVSLKNIDGETQALLEDPERILNVVINCAG
jgi:threonine dehydrogenase-like Zn-dependent dehydrogenase